MKLSRSIKEMISRLRQKELELAIKDTDAGFLGVYASQTHKNILWLKLSLAGLTQKNILWLTERNLSTKTHPIFMNVKNYVNIVDSCMTIGNTLSCEL